MICFCATQRKEESFPAAAGRGNVGDTGVSPPPAAAATCFSQTMCAIGPAPANNPY